MARRVVSNNSKASIFSGGAGNLSFGDFLDPGVSDFSVMCWFKPASAPINGQKMLMSKKTASTPGVVGWYIGASSASTVPFGLIQVVIDDGTSRVTKNSSTPAALDKWNHLVVTFNRAGSLTIYLNGVFDSSQSIAAVGSLTTTSPLRCFSDGSGANAFRGNICHFRQYARVLTQVEITDLYFQNEVPATPAGEWLMQDGGGVTAVDSSGNGHNGTLTTVVFDNDSPGKARTEVGGNLLVNANFDYAPPFVAATTTSPRVIDGTAAGSTSNNVLAWCNDGAAAIGSGAIQYDPTVSYSGGNSLKVSTKAITSAVAASPVRSTSSAANVKLRAIPVLPSTQYMLVYWMKTNYVSGDATSGACGALKTFDGNGTALVTTNHGTIVKTTQDWTRYTLTITTGATARYITPLLRIIGNDGASTLIMDAWFDDVELIPVTRTTRNATTFSSRVLNREFGTALLGNGGTCITTSAGVSVAQVGGISCAFWLKNTIASGQTLMRFQLMAGSLTGARINIETTRKLFVWGVNTSASGTAVIKPANLLSKDVWHHIVFTVIWDQASLVTASIYVDGVLWGTGSYAGDIQPTDAFTTVGNATGGDVFDDVQVYSRVLSAAEILQMYITGNSPTDKKIWWKFDEGSGSSATDSSGNGKTGTIATSTYRTDVPMKARLTP